MAYISLTYISCNVLVVGTHHMVQGEELPGMITVLGKSVHYRAQGQQLYKIWLACKNEIRFFRKLRFQSSTNRSRFNPQISSVDDNCRSVIIPFPSWLHIPVFMTRWDFVCLCLCNTIIYVIHDIYAARIKTFPSDQWCKILELVYKPNSSALKNNHHESLPFSLKIFCSCNLFIRDSINVLRLGKLKDLFFCLRQF